jgi:hypothetical protein
MWWRRWRPLNANERHWVALRRGRDDLFNHELAGLGASVRATEPEWYVARWHYINWGSVYTGPFLDPQVEHWAERFWRALCDGDALDELRRSVLTAEEHAAALADDAGPSPFD